MRLPALALVGAVVGGGLLMRLVPDGNALEWSPSPAEAGAGLNAVALADVAMRAVAPIGRPLPVVRAVPKRATPTASATVPVELGPRLAVAWPPPVGGPRCDETQPAGDEARYEGDSVSKLYDILFAPDAAMPFLSRYTPQGLTTWLDWDRAGHTLLLLGMYEHGSNSYLVGIDPERQSIVGTVQVYESHLGGIGVIGPWLITQDTDTHPPQSVRRYRLDQLRAAMAESASEGDKPYLHSDGDPQPVFAAQFMAVRGNSVWLGRHSRQGPATMYRYTVGDDGILNVVEGPWVVPARLQGLVVTENYFVFAADEGRGPGQLTVFRRAAPPDLDDPVACLWMPSMPENMTVLDGRVFASYEGGAAQYDQPSTVNKIKKLHSGSLRALLGVADPSAFAGLTRPAWADQFDPGEPVPVVSRPPAA